MYLLQIIENQPVIFSGFSDSKKIKSFFLQIISFIFLLIFSSQAFAQNFENQSLIVKYLGEEKFFELTQKNPAYLNFLDARYSHGYLIMDYVDEKMSEFPTLDIIYHSAWRVVDINGKNCDEVVESKVTPEEFLIASESVDFNFLEYKFLFDRSEVTYYILGNTGKVIMIAAVDNINHIVNKEN